VALVRLSDQLVDEAHGLGEGTIVLAVVAEASREVAIECGGLVTDPTWLTIMDFRPA
jgi:hypothetical protein